MSELTVDFWVTVSVIPMVIALGIYLWLSKRFDRTQEQEARRYEELVQKAQEPLDGTLQANAMAKRPETRSPPSKDR